MKRLLYRLSEMRWWIVHRTFDRYDWVKVYGMKPGYADVDERMLGACLGLLVDYVEIELASADEWQNHKGSTIWDRLRFDWLFYKYRNREYGLSRLDWECAQTNDYSPEEEDYGKPSGQAVSAAEVKAIYLWAKDTRPKRPEPLIASGFCNEGWDDPDIPDDERARRALLSHEIEQQYDKEDEEMLCRLMKVRLSLWT